LGLTATKMVRLTDIGLVGLFNRERALWSEIAQNAYAYAAGFIEPRGGQVRPDDLIASLVPVLEITDELREALVKYPQKYWYEWFAELIVDMLWTELRGGA
jgi:hypothetical protein